MNKEEAIEALEYAEFCTHISTDTFNGKKCDPDTKQAYEEILLTIRENIKKAMEHLA